MMCFQSSFSFSLSNFIFFEQLRRFHCEPNNHISFWSDLDELIIFFFNFVNWDAVKIRRRDLMLDLENGMKWVSTIINMI